MPRVRLDPLQSVLVIVDVQPLLTKTTFEIDRVLARIGFLAKVCGVLEIPILATEQNPSRMGGTVEELAGLILPGSIFSKMAFSAWGCDEFVGALEATGRRQVVVVGLETHICVSQTAQDLLDQGFEVVVCPDAVSARTQERHKLGMERLRDAGVAPAHVESVAYEWLGSASHPRFKEFLGLVKELGL